jgi:hypothetical protein
MSYRVVMDVSALERDILKSKGYWQSMSDVCVLCVCSQLLRTALGTRKAQNRMPSV